MNMKLTALGALLVVAILQQGCIVARVATAPVRYAAHRAAIARAEKRGEKKGEKRAEEKAAERAAAPQHIERPDTQPPAAPVDVPAN